MVNVTIYTIHGSYGIYIYILNNYKSLKIGFSKISMIFPWYFHDLHMAQAAAELNAADGNSRSALYLAAEMGHVQVVQRLLQATDRKTHWETHGNTGTMEIPCEYHVN
jgi:uncharacterized protein YqjF (DUF2071 family)